MKSQVPSNRRAGGCLANFDIVGGTRKGLEGEGGLLATARIIIAHNGSKTPTQAGPYCDESIVIRTQGVKIYGLVIRRRKLIPKGGAPLTQSAIGNGRIIGSR